MQYSFVNGQRSEPFPKGKGICDICNSATIAKCGEKKIWHWAHKSKLDCDPWWENETEWHRQWKGRFPENYREVVHHCPVSGEKHRADIKSDKGIVLEIQNSPISLEEMRSRENFYKNLVWIINGEKFRRRFTIFPTYLPSPDSKEFDDIIFEPTNNVHSCAMFRRKVGDPHRIYSSREIKAKMDKNYIGHHPYSWQRPHVAWLEAKCPVFIDFGDEFLWGLVKYKDQFQCVRAVAKQRIISDIMLESLVQNIAVGHSILKDDDRSVARG